MSSPAADFVRASRLPPDPSSPSRARAFVTEALQAFDRDADAELAALLVSETVTNAVLHAGTDVEVRCRVVGEVVRIEVRDGSSIMPGRRHYEEAAMTGRGLGMVEALARDWGVDCHPAGKTVWFELGPVDAGPAVAASPLPAAPAASVAVRLLRVPVGLVRMTVQYGDAVLREVALLAATQGTDAKRDLRAPQFDLTPILEPVDAAWEAGEPSVDLEIDVPIGAAAGALERMARIDEADRMAREGLLLTRPALPEVGACRRWLFGQVALQAGGGPATPWELPQDLEVERVPAPLPPGARAQLEASTVAVVVADEGNRIVFANEATSDLLGWPDGTLVGRRLTTIVPPELREAHLVGYTRYLLTGAGTVLGRTLQLPALHHDGRRVPVDLVIQALPAADGRTLLRATLTAVIEDGGGQAGPEPTPPDPEA